MLFGVGVGTCLPLRRMGGLVVVVVVVRVVGGCYCCGRRRGRCPCFCRCIHVGAGVLRGILRRGLVCIRRRLFGTCTILLPHPPPRYNCLDDDDDGEIDGHTPPVRGHCVCMPLWSRGSLCLPIPGLRTSYLLDCLLLSSCCRCVVVVSSLLLNWLMRLL